MSDEVFSFAHSELHFASGGGSVDIFTFFIGAFRFDAAARAFWSVSSLPGIPLWPGIQCVSEVMRKFLSSGDDRDGFLC